MRAAPRRIRPALRREWSHVARLEQARLELQARLDAGKSLSERNKQGQFATPPLLAEEIVAVSLALRNSRTPVRFLDPAFGTGAFYSALLRLSPHSLQAATGFEIDRHYGDDTQKLWCGTPLDLCLADFTRTKPPETEAQKSNVVICNPPYVRHHHLSRDQKRHLQCAAESLGTPLNGLSGLYCYFLVLSQAWMAKSGIATWLVPSEFMDVNYGVAVKRFLLECVTLLRVHRFNAADVQFDDALVSSAVVFFRNERPAADHVVEFTQGGKLTAPQQSERITATSLRDVNKWTQLPHRQHLRRAKPSRVTLSDLFVIKRGLATGGNEFFVVTPERAKELRIPRRFLTPILPSPRFLDIDEVAVDPQGEPAIEARRYLIDCRLPWNEVRRESPALWRYLQSGRRLGIDQRYLCRHRAPWYVQEVRPPSPLLCTYMGRARGENGTPFRFILNHSRATAANVYLMLYPKPWLRGMFARSPELIRTVWTRLRAIGGRELTSEGRVYGGGLHKLEPRELGNVSADEVFGALPQSEETQGWLSLGFLRGASMRTARGSVRHRR